MSPPIMPPEPVPVPVVTVTVTLEQVALLYFDVFAAYTRHFAAPALSTLVVKLNAPRRDDLPVACVTHLRPDFVCSATVRLALGDSLPLNDTLMPAATDAGGAVSLHDDFFGLAMAAEPPQRTMASASARPAASVFTPPTYVLPARTARPTA